MKIRNRKITVRLTDTERNHLQEQADLVDMKIEPFVRELVMGSQMTPYPKEEWTELLRQVSGVANNINQISKSTNSGQPLSEQTLNQLQDMLAQIWEKVKMI